MTTPSVQPGPTAPTTTNTANTANTATAAGANTRPKRTIRNIWDERTRDNAEAAKNAADTNRDGNLSDTEMAGYLCSTGDKGATDTDNDNNRLDLGENCSLTVERDAQGNVTKARVYNGRNGNNWLGLTVHNADGTREEHSDAGKEGMFERKDVYDRNGRLVTSYGDYDVANRQWRFARQDNKLYVNNNMQGNTDWEVNGVAETGTETFANKYTAGINGQLIDGITSTAGTIQTTTGAVGTGSTETTESTDDDGTRTRINGEVTSFVNEISGYTPDKIPAKVEEFLTGKSPQEIAIYRAAILQQMSSGVVTNGGNDVINIAVVEALFGQMGVKHDANTPLPEDPTEATQGVLRALQAELATRGTSLEQVLFDLRDKTEEDAQNVAWLLNMYAAHMYGTNALKGQSGGLPPASGRGESTVTANNDGTWTITDGKGRTIKYETNYNGLEENNVNFTYTRNEYNGNALMKSVVDTYRASAQTTTEYTGYITRNGQAYATIRKNRDGLQVRGTDNEQFKPVPNEKYENPYDVLINGKSYQERVRAIVQLLSEFTVGEDFEFTLIGDWDLPVINELLSANGQILVKNGNRWRLASLES